MKGLLVSMVTALYRWHRDAHRYPSLDLCSMWIGQEEVIKQHLNVFVQLFRATSLF